MIFYMDIFTAVALLLVPALPALGAMFPHRD